MSILDAEFFRDEAAAFAKLESVMWPYGPECPHCGVLNDAHKIAANVDKNVRHGLYRCNACKQQFTVTVGSVFERSHIPLHKWLQAAYLICSSKKGISAKQIERTLQVTYKSAWFMMHRLREAMKPVNPSRMGGEGKIIESDETFLGRKKGAALRRGTGHKMAILTLVERGGKARSFKIDRVTRKNIQDVLAQHVDPASRLMTDDAAYYGFGLGMKNHDKVNHRAGEYARGDVTTNTVEGFFSVFKRGMKGIYQHCGRYLAEFDFRYNNREALGINDSERTLNALSGAKGKRLTYRGPDSTA